MIDYDKTLETLKAAMGKATDKDDIDNLAAAITAVTMSRDENAALYKKNSELAASYREAVLNSNLPKDKEAPSLKAPEVEKPAEINAEDYIAKVFEPEKEEK